MPGKTMTVQGDTWDIVSYRVYGDEAYISALIAANPSHRMTTIFGANVELIIPDIPTPIVSASLPPWVRARADNA